MADVPSWARPLESSSVPDWARPLDAAPARFSPHVDPMEGMSASDKLKAGFGLGMLNMIRSAAGLLPGKAGRSLLGALPGADKETSVALLGDPKNVIASFHVPDVIPFFGGQYNVTPGKVGNFVGETAATLPAASAATGLTGLGLAGIGARSAAPGLAGLLTRALPVLAGGAAQGTVLGGPEHRILGALLGLGFAGAGSAATEGFGPLARGIVKPTPAAAELMSRGVPLSIGQMNPEGALSTIEEAGLHSAMGGKSIAATRNAAREATQRLAAQEALAPGATLPDGPVRAGDFMSKLHDAFDPAYSQIDATPVPAYIKGVPTSRIVKEAFKKVIQDDNVIGSEGVRAAANRFLQNQATILDKAPIFDATGEPFVAPKAAPSGAKALIPASELRITAPTERWSEAPLSQSTANVRSGSPQFDAVETPREGFHTAEPLRVIRSNIRTKLRGLSDSTPEGAATIEMLTNAEDLLTDAMEKRLGPSGAASLRAIDARYANLRALDKAVNSAKASELGFTSNQLHDASTQGLSDIAKARGEGGSLRELAQLGRDVLDTKSPMTGAKLLTLPLGGNHLAGPLMSILNRSGRGFAIGATAPQRAATTLMDIIQASLPNSTGAGAFLPRPNAYLAPLGVHER